MKGTTSNKIFYLFIIVPVWHQQGYRMYNGNKHGNFYYYELWYGNIFWYVRYFNFFGHWPASQVLLAQLFFFIIKYVSPGSNLPAVFYLELPCRKKSHHHQCLYFERPVKCLLTWAQNWNDLSSLPITLWVWTRTAWDYKLPQRTAPRESHEYCLADVLSQIFPEIVLNLTTIYLVIVQDMLGEGTSKINFINIDVIRLIKFVYSTCPLHYELLGHSNCT